MNHRFNFSAENSVLKITYIESPEGLAHKGYEWEKLQQKILKEKTDVLVTNEMPFGNWLAASSEYDAVNAKKSMLAHDLGVNALKRLGLPLVLSSRPTLSVNKLANEAFFLVDGEYHYAHQKHYFPEEPGFYETSWFHTDQKGFEVIRANGLTVGFLLCTELMFNEWARFYRQQGAHLIVVPRASEQGFERWKTAASMAAIVSGCYVVSSNRVGETGTELIFGGKGFAFAPDGSQISETTSDNPVVSFDLDLCVVEKQQKQYPCYVSEVELV